MAASKLTVVISQSQSRNPQQKELEEELAARLMIQGQVEVAVVPHLYDLHAEHTGMLFLRSIPGDIVVLSWLYPRPTRWILHRQGILGKEGTSLLIEERDDDEEEENDPQEAAADRGVGIGKLPNRYIYCIDLRVSSSVQDYIDEIERINKERSVQTIELLDWIQGSPRPEQLQRYLRTPGGNGSSQGNGAGNGHATSPSNGSSAAGDSAGETTTGALPEESVKRRWYPVIDYERCTNCLECIDFCLFGVYGVTENDLILVETQDNCKKGCPACSRVCPENAIMFPGHKSSAIAGAEGEVAGFKVDLSKLFGAQSAIDMAVRERDRELVADGRDAVGAAVGLGTRRNSPATPRNHLDDLMDSLDELEL